MQPEQQGDSDEWPMPSDDVRRELERPPVAWSDRPGEPEPVAFQAA